VLSFHDRQLALLEPMQEFTPRSRTLRCVKSLEPAPGTDEPLYGALVLCHNGVAVLDLVACDDYPLRLLLSLAGHFMGVTAVNRDRPHVVLVME
jgi:hypothetical protein